MSARLFSRWESRSMINPSAVLIFDDAAINHWASLAVPGLYAFINRPDRRIDIRHSSNVLEAVARHTSQIANGSHECRGLILDREKLHCVLLERVMHGPTRLIHHAMWVKHYRSNGYTLYRSRSASRFYLRRDVLGALMFVKLVNSNHDELVVGVFMHANEADAFITKYYPDPPYNPIYASNQLTRDYYRNVGGVGGGRVGG